MDIYNPNQNVYYVYAYLRKDYTPYYIGKGKNKRIYTKHSVTIPKDKSRIIIIHDNLTELQSLILERYYIRWFGRKINNTGILRNIMPGGEGSDSETASRMNTERAIKGTNPFCRRKDGTSVASDKVKSGIHHWLHEDRSAENNPRYIQTIYQFKHKTGTIYIGTPYNFRITYNLDQGNVTKMIQGKSKSVKGWSIY